MANKFICFVFSLFLCLLGTSGTAQSPVGHCGTGTDMETFSAMRSRALAHLARPHTARERDDETIYIPVKYHLYGRDDGSSAADFSDILELHLRLNEEYAEHDIQFYINGGLDIVANTDYYENPGEHINHQQQIFSNNSVNVYIGNSADIDTDNGAGLTLGYYFPTYDWIVMRKSEAKYNAETLAHEMGHFFSLNHTFFGWECIAWQDWLSENPGAECAPTTAPCFDIPVEAADGSNCETAADFLCDTPADYRFTSANCVYADAACDPDGEPLMPLTDNIMSYFFGCEDQTFTEQQADMLMTDINAPTRNYLRTDGGPDKVTAPSAAPDPAYPAEAEELPNYNVTVGWRPVQHATYYVVQRGANSAFTIFDRQYVTRDTFLTMSDLSPEFRYYWRVTPFNEYQTALQWSESRTFVTGTEFINPGAPLQNHLLEVTPNLIQRGREMQINVTAKENFTSRIEIYATDGRMVQQTEEREFSEGENNFSLYPTRLQSGLYIVVLRDGSEVQTQKIVLFE